MRDKRSDRFLPAWVIQVVGIAVLVASLVLWRVTKDEPTAILAIAGAMILLGGGAERTVYEARRALGRRGERDDSEGDP